MLARYQYPNPLDLLFFAGEQATRRAGLPGVHVHIHMELGGTLDVAGLRRALLDLYRVYPAIGARRELSLVTGRPRWRLDVPAADPRRIVRVHTLSPATTAQMQHAAETLLATPLDAANLPPVQFHVFRGLPTGDVLVMRWPHALMDGRGAFTILEELDRLYVERPERATLHTAGDEDRDDFNQMLQRYTPLERVKMLRELRQNTAKTGPVIHLSQAPIPARGGRLRHVLRTLTPQETAQVDETCRRVSGTPLSGDFLRACALGALHEVLRRPVPADAVYTTNSLLDNRRRQGPAVCWNLTSALPIVVPAAMVEDCQATTALIHRQMIAHVRARSAHRYYAAFALLLRAPTAYVGALLKTNMRSSKPAAKGMGLAQTPSLRLDFIGPFTRPLPTFCGTPLINHYGYSTLLPQPGFALHVNLTRERLNVSGVCMEERVPATLLAELIERMGARLLARE